MSDEPRLEQQTEIAMTSAKNYHNTLPCKQRIYPVTEGIQSSQTAIVYERCFNHFLDHIQIHDRQVLLDFSSKPKVIKEMIVDYVLYLRDEKRLSRASIKVHLSAILHWFQINNDDFNLTIRNFRIHLPSDDSAKDEDRPYKTEEIGRILQECDIRSRVAILLLCSTGMRLGALHTIQISDLTEVEISGSTKLFKIQVYARTHDKYYTFCTPECAKAIQDYLDYRKRSGEVLQPKAPLIREQFNKDDKIRIQYPRFVTRRAVEYLVDEVLKRSGVRSKEVHMTSGFRKHFMTTCERSGMRSINVKMLLGHDIGVSQAYYCPAEQDILSDYMSHASDALTISPEHRLKSRVQALESEKSEEIVQLKARVEELDRWVHRWSKYAHTLRDGKVKALED